MPSRNTYRLTWVSLTLDKGYLLMALLHQHSRRSLDMGLFLSPTSPNLGTLVDPLGHCP